MSDIARYSSIEQLGTGTEIEIRRVFEAEDFGANMTPEIKEREERLRNQLSKKK